MRRKGRKPKSRKIRRPKTRLGLPDLDQSKAAVIGSLRSPESQRGYRHAISEFIDWYCSEPRLSFNRTVVLRYRMHLESRNLAPGTINVRLAAVRRLAYEAADAGLLSPELAAGIRRVKGAKKLGIRLGNWLLASEARALWQSPDAETLKGKRDRAIIAVLLGCGLRRRELADLTFDHLQRREDHWAIVDLVGKGGHVRTVPVPDWVKQFLDEWFAGAEIANGKLFRCVSFRKGVGRRNDGKGCLACREDICQETGDPEASASRSQEVVCTVLPRCRRRIGTNSILAGACFRANNRALPGVQTKIS